MKIRNGFVSNSSSSSFVIRGVKVKKEDLAKFWNLEITDDNIEMYCGRNGAIQDRAWSYAGKNGLDIEDTRDFFDGDQTDDMIIGKDICGLEDGVAIEMPEISDDEDTEIIEKLAEHGIKVDVLSTFIQFISNDNY
jgi:hypothetical protein